ncbi:glycosyltransferase [Shewanella algae]|uniref:glycosyltransferase n=1 Tax=Shewanella algae TaxID=38313 RepID=UPI0011842280|nr:glycosyltransferase [Shewanella algae]
MNKAKKAIFLKNSSKPIPRVKRMMLVAYDLKYDCLFIGAYRSESDQPREVWDGVEISRVGRYYPPLNGKNLFKLVFSLFSLNWGMIRALFEEKPDLIHSSDIETAIPAFIYSKIKNVPVIYNIHDNLHQRYAVGSFAQGILRFIESFFIYSFDATTVPEEFRKQAYPALCQKKIHIIKNSPDISSTTNKNRFSTTGLINILYAGWLDEGRGLDYLLDLAINENIHVTIAGLGDSRFLERIKALKNVTYKGFLSHSDILELTCQTDFVFAVYDPVRIINKYAASNKIAEALYFGKPVICNNEMKIASLLVENNCCVSFDYADVSSVYPKLCELKSNRSDYMLMSDNAINLYNKEYSWETVKNSIYAIFNLVGGLDVQK